ncbi:hypothetical protein EC844_11462 [Acinetobacter calcoaceticus]|uniref:DUF1853 family protein n=1 Tax=Acinetobacter calcoaceticus TaxID=471 RepID=A0A4R1XQ08_ACICA|nr:hypothetical protein EC844_11462 [Acinetobacter calcoaceticus]
MSNYFEPWLTFKHPLVRQLAFCIASPNVLRQTPDELNLLQHFAWHHPQFWQQHYLRYQSRLAELDLDPSPLLLFFTQLKSTRLGLQFEYLIWFWLLDDKYHDYTLLAHSLQIIDGRNTLGELDFVLLNRNTQQVEHWEVALKYYLGEADLSLQHWYGLNRDDTLWKKLNHFNVQQFKFEHAKQHQIEKRYAIVKGQLYLPTHRYDPSMQNQPLPPWIETERRLGYWGNQLYMQHFSRLKRHEWLCIDQKNSLIEAKWWSNGLYFNSTKNEYYMFRQPSILYTHVYNL